MIWRNVSTSTISELDVFLEEARTFSGRLFMMVYGPDVYRYFAPDNSIRVFSIWREPKVAPYKPKKGERLAKPQKKDKVIIIEDGEELWGHVVFHGEDDTGVYVYKHQELKTYPSDCLETCRERARWRIHVS